MSSTLQRESVNRAIADLEAAVGRADGLMYSSVSQVARAGDRWAVVVAAETFGAAGRSTFAFHPRFVSRLDAEAFRTAALEIVSAAA